MPTHRILSGIDLISRTILNCMKNRKWNITSKTLASEKSAGTKKENAILVWNVRCICMTLYWHPLDRSASSTLWTAFYACSGVFFLAFDLIHHHLAYVEIKSRSDRKQRICSASLGWDGRMLIFSVPYFVFHFNVSFNLKNRWENFNVPGIYDG